MSWLKKAWKKTTGAVKELGRDIDPSRAGGLANMVTFGGAHAVGLDDKLNDLQASAGLGGTTDAQRAAKAAEEQKKTAEQKQQEAAEKWAGEFGDWRTRWNAVGDTHDANGNLTRTGARAKELGDLYTGEVDRGMWDAGSNTAAAMARRGISDSGYAQAGQNDVIGKAAAARALARESAMKEAVGEGMQIGMGELSGLVPQTETAMSAYNMQYANAVQQLLLQQQFAQRDKEQQMEMLASLSNLAFMKPS